MCTPVDKKKTTSPVPNSSPRAYSSNTASGLHPVSRSPRPKWSFTSSRSRMSSISAGGTRSKRSSLSRSANPARRRAVRVLDSDGDNVTPMPLCHAVSAPGVMQSKPGRFLDEMFSGSGSEYSKYTSSSFVESSLPITLLTKASLTKETEDSVRKLDIPKKKTATCADVTVTEEMLDEAVGIYLSETDTISLLDIPPTYVSEDADDGEAIKEKNTHYVDLCKHRMGNNKYVAGSTQTFDGAPKDKQVQSDKIVSVDKGSMATVWDIYDCFCDQNKTPESEKGAYPERTVDTSKGQEKRGETTFSSSTVSTGSTISSLLDMEMCSSSLKLEPDPQLIVLSESFQHSLLVMERSIVGNIFQPKLAAYRQLPVREDPDSTVTPDTEEQGEENSSSPTLKHLWAFSCELTRGYNINSMAWNKVNQDILAVGYGDISNQKPGLICCWSIKNPTWPERVFHCHSCVTSLDFSANNPSKLAVGMYDGTVAIYNVQSQDNMACDASSSECSEKYLHPVWQVYWTKQERRLSGKEALVSVSEDGRFTKWFLCSNGLDCIDLMKLKKTQNIKKSAAGDKRETDIFLSPMVPGLCFDLNPTDSSIYLIGTWNGLIHRCSFSNTEDFLDTYKKHICPVNHIEWSPFISDVFLSCSSDWTIQLWKQDLFTPVLSFTSTQEAVCAVRWSPNWSTIFAALKEQQVEIWDLNSNIQFPIIVHHAAPGVRLTSLLFARGTDCVLVGDSEAQVTVYKLKNLNVGEGKQVDSLEDITHSTVSSLL